LDSPFYFVGIPEKKSVRQGFPFALGMTTKISEYIRGWNKMKKRSFIYFCEFMGGRIAFKFFPQNIL
jgi:hypothetical protein